MNLCQGRVQSPQSKRRKLYSISLTTLVLIAAGACTSSSVEKTRGTQDSIERQLRSPGPILYKDLAKQAYEDGGWSDSRILEGWLKPFGSNPEGTVRRHAHDTVWLIPNPDQREVVTAVYLLDVNNFNGPVRHWLFFTDASDIILGYTDSKSAQSR